MARVSTLTRCALPSAVYLAGGGISPCRHGSGEAPWFECSLLPVARPRVQPGVSTGPALPLPLLLCFWPRSAVGVRPSLVCLCAPLHLRYFSILRSV